MQLHTRRMFAVTTLAVGLVVALAGSVLAQSDLGLGTWKLNVAKSKYDPGPAPSSETRVYVLWEKDGVKATFTRVEGGKTLTLGYAAHYDAKDYKYTGAAAYDTITLTRVDASTTEASLKKGGKVVQTTKTVISKDGKTRTQTVKGIDASGKAVNNLSVFEKQ